MTELITCDMSTSTWVLTLNRPDQLNAIDPETCARLAEIVGAADADPSARVLLITGAGRAFSAGADISVLETLADGPDFGRFVTHLTDAYRVIETARTPSIAAINGAALGGGLELALACDFRIASTTASFGLPEIRLGLLPGAGGTQRFPRLVGASVARRMLFTGLAIKSAEALEVGLVDQVVAPEDLMTAAQALASSLKEVSADAIAAGKRLLNEGAALDLAAAIELEREVVSELFEGPDRVEGIAAFRERRPPRF